jgi:hypothetical protein
MVFSIIFLEDKHNILLHLSIFYEYQQFFFQHYLFLDTNETSHVTTHATHSDLWPTLARSTSFFLVMLFNKMDKLFINWPNILKLIIILHRYHICTYNCKKIVDLKNEFLRFYFWRFIEVKQAITNEYTTYLIR